jgi:hypothetical protein
MRWYASAQGQSSGPFEEHQIIDLIRAGRIDHVQGEAGGNWIPVHASPFAGYVAAPQFGVPATPQPGGNRPAKKSSGAQWLFVIAAAAGVIISSASGWLGLVLGLGLAAWSIDRHRKGRRSLMAIAWSAPAGMLTTVGTVAIGLLFATCGSGSILAKRQAAAAQEKLAAEEKARAEQDAKAKAKLRAELIAALPATIATVRQTMAKGMDAANRGDPANGLASTNEAHEAVRKQLDAIGHPTPPTLEALGRDCAAQAAKLESRVKLATSLKEAVAQIAAGKNNTKKQAWLAADGEFAAALSAVDVVQSAPADLKQYIPADFNPQAKRSEVEQLRKAIAAPVAREQQLKESLARLEGIKSSLKASDRASYQRAKTELTAESKTCGRCAAAATIAATVREVDSTLQNWPIDLASIQEMKTRYADLKGRRIRVKGTLSTSTYYNCRYASQNDWRSLELSDTIVGGVHAYCSRGDTGCESIFQPLASGGSQTGIATVEYASSNSVCEESQVQLVRWEWER